jgi:DNA-binding HxlR family transcriptional regulator
VIIRDLFIGKKSFREFLESPENISTSVLSNRLQLMEVEGIALHVLSATDKKVKLYYLTDLGIDLFPVLYEMVHWSMRNLTKDFYPIAKDLFETHKSFTNNQTITMNQDNYKEKREELLAF